MENETTETRPNNDEFTMLRETTIEGQTFRVTAQFVRGSRVLLEFASETSEGEITGGLNGEIEVLELLPAASALSSMFGGVAVAVGAARAGKNFDVKQARRRYPKAYQGWTKFEEKRLLERYRAGATVEELSKEFSRQPGGIRSRLAKLGLEQLEAAPREPH
jgi:hypothetical protein